MNAKARNEQDDWFLIDDDYQNCNLLVIRDVPALIKLISESTCNRVGEKAVKGIVDLLGIAPVAVDQDEVLWENGAFLIVESQYTNWLSEARARVSKRPSAIRFVRGDGTVKRSRPTFKEWVAQSKMEAAKESMMAARQM